MKNLKTLCTPLSHLGKMCAYGLLNNMPSPQRSSYKARKVTTCTLLAATILFSGCKSDDDSSSYIDIPEPPTAQEFNALIQNTLESYIQNFQFEADGSTVEFNSEAGVQLQINTGCLTLNGNAVTGTVDLEYIELFSKADMLVTNKPTMGILPDNSRDVMVSGGEFYINLTQNGTQLEAICEYRLRVPDELTGGEDQNMELWDGIIDQNGDLSWESNSSSVFYEGGSYYAFLDRFGWTNIDRFTADPRPKTTINVQVPDGYNLGNSKIYISYDGENHLLGTVHIFNDGVFSEHYGKLPVGLACHIIFITERNGNFSYAIKPITIEENHTISFSIPETTTGTQDDILTAIEALP